MLLRLLALSVCLLVSAAALPSNAVARECSGDCDGDDFVDDNDIRLGITALFDLDAGLQCPTIGRDPEAPPDAADLVAAIAHAIGTCNLAPVAVDPPIYRGFAGNEIAMPVWVSDPDGDHLTFTATGLPVGATLDPGEGVIRWMPGEDQIGDYCVDVSIADDGFPERTAQSRVLFKISALDPCTVADCDPATGCTSSLLPISENCCEYVPKRECDTMTALPRFSPQPLPRVAEPDDARCPEGEVMLIGRNPRGFGLGGIQNCEYLRLSAQSQSGVTSLVGVEGRCLPVLTPLTAHVHLETSDRVHTERDIPNVLQPRDDGTNYAEFPNRLSFDVNDITPDYEQREANLSVRITNTATGESWTQSARVILTHCNPFPLTDVLPEPCPEE